MDLVKKAVGLVEMTETDNPNGEFEVILSAATLDRDGEIIDSRAFEPLPDHVPFDIDHGMTVQTTMGSGTPYYAEDGSLRVKGTFASTPLAQEVRTLVNEGHIRTTSVTFMAAERVKDEKSIDHVVRAELLNGTFTPVPSNREAVALSSKAFNAVVDEKATSCPVCAAKSVSEDDTETVIEDPADEAQEVETADETAGDAADEAASPAVKSAVTPPEVLARLAITENAARLAFGA